ncbi:hypothetical protein C3F34_13400 [Acinetobacter sp. ACNIH2]|uniref:hypothetical protein n=1 Tax=Acinetobacter sp. ACNIH2 TaxID=1758189 RepID=UPI000CDCB9D3|nr:hypothetical protein [Acinetobacter sp. ACNIH2]AUX86930.1 hypothetical protein C3F34_13400 [Acinetobacter sp. ACNIH2]
METLLKIGGVLAVLVVPIVLAFLNNRLAHLKHTQESKAEALKQAEQFETKGLDKRSTLYKDRLAKSAFNDDAITYSEVKFFLNYENADLWISEYVKIRGMLTRKRDDTGEVTGFKPKYNWIKGLSAFAGYGVFAFVGLIPFVIMNKYIAIMVSSYEKGIPLWIALMVAIPIMALAIAYLCLKYVERCADCGNFLSNFKKYAYEVPVEKKVSEENIAA